MSKPDTSSRFSDARSDKYTGAATYERRETPQTTSAPEPNWRVVTTHQAKDLNVRVTTRPPAVPLHK